MEPLKEFDPESEDERIRAESRLVSRCWSPYTIVYDPLKNGSIDGTRPVVPHDRAILRAMSASFRPYPGIPGNPENTVFVGRLSHQTDDETLKKEFSRYGDIVRHRVVRCVVTGDHKGYGFVEFANARQAMRAYTKAHKTFIDGSRIIVDMECGRLLPGWVPRRLGGGFHGRKESGQLRFGCRERPFQKPIKLCSQGELKKAYEKLGKREEPKESK